MVTFMLFGALAACPVHASSAVQDTPQTGRDIASLRSMAQRSFGGEVTREQATTVAAAAAREELRQDVIRSIVLRPEVRFAKSPGTSGARPPDLAALADAVAPARVLLVGYSASPSVVSVTVAPEETTAGDELSDRIRNALINPGKLELYRRAAAREKALVKEFDALAIRDGHRNTDEADGHNRARLKALTDGLEAIARYRAILPLGNGIWREPRAVLAATEQALTLDKENPDLYAIFGEACLQLGRSHEAMEAQSKALRLDPGFARAHHARGVAYLALRLPVLAAADFTEAIRLSPKTAVYHRDRGMAWMVQKDDARMCQDFYSACALGDCEKYRWSVDQGKCSAAP